MRQEKRINIAGDEIDFWNLNSLGTRKDVLVAENEEKPSRVAH